MHFGTPTDHEKRCFTRVLQGHITLADAVFPSGTSGHLIDSFARMALWQDGLDFRHGTGHGVGHHLNVHEGPQGVSSHVRSYAGGMKAGMTMTIEPGYYEEASEDGASGGGGGGGGFGIRIENVYVTVSKETRHCFGGAPGFVGFDSLTLVPFQRSLIDMSLLTARQVEWIDAYHCSVREELGPLLEGDARAWMEKETTPL